MKRGMKTILFSSLFSVLLILSVGFVCALSLSFNSMNSPPGGDPFIGCGSLSKCGGLSPVTLSSSGNEVGKILRLSNINGQTCPRIYGSPCSSAFGQCSRNCSVCMEGSGNNSALCSTNSFNKIGFYRSDNTLISKYSLNNFFGTGIIVPNNTKYIYAFVDDACFADNNINPNFKCTFDYTISACKTCAVDYVDKCGASLDDGCGGTLNCINNCLNGKTCTNNICQTIPLAQTCADSDGGKNIYVKGQMNATENTLNGKDTCGIGNYLSNGGFQFAPIYSCKGDNCYISEYYTQRISDAIPCRGYAESIKCSNGCIDGACVQAPRVTCTDSDGGKNYYVNGTTSGNYYNETATSNDVCSIDGRTLKELFCFEDQIYSEYYNCPNGCSNGACVQTSNITSCVDNDGGLKYYIKGSVSGIGSGAVYEDYCLNNSDLIERYCTGDPNLFTMQYHCPNGCSNGTCVPENQNNITQQCIDSDAGENYYISGTITYTNNYGQLTTEQDFCSDATNPQSWVTVPYCSGNNCYGRDKFCQNSTTFAGTGSQLCVNGCSNGACVPENQNNITQQCIDSDNGWDYYTPGYATGRFYLGNSIINETVGTYYDSCQDSQNILEAYCYNDSQGRNYIRMISAPCLNGCGNGTCLIDTTPCTNGERRCSPGGVFGDGSYQVCNNNLWSVNLLVCPYLHTCENGNCIRVENCTPGQRICSSENTYKICSQEGFWGNLNETCPQGQYCDSGFCDVNKCNPGQRNCIPLYGNKSYQLCNNAGQWDPIQQCDQTQICSEGNCIAVLGTCNSIGLRQNGRYCNPSSLWQEQKQSNSLCENSFECRGNLCIDSKCVDSNLIQKFLQWLMSLFGGNSNNNSNNQTQNSNQTN